MRFPLFFFPGKSIGEPLETVLFGFTQAPSCQTIGGRFLLV